MNWLIVFAVVAVTAATSSHKPHFEAFSDELIRYVNEQSGASWKAAPSTRFESLEHFKLHLGARFETAEQRNTRRVTISHPIKEDDLPDTFDAREKWPNCPSIAEIRDQSSCGSCWAFGAVTSMTDRVCIHSKGRLTADLSARDLLSCCSYCGFGCRGGWIALAWDFWKEEGIVTGGSKEDPKGCRPYPFPKCGHHGSSPGLKPCQKDLYPTPTCKTVCEKQYNGTYRKDKIYGLSSYNVPANEADIMYEIMNNGPVEAGFEVYEDFGNYATGIYHHVAGKYLGGHAVRIIGWGVEKGEKYWLVANSWNEGWGEKGTFRIRRGNECGIEERVSAGMPNV